MKKSIFFLVFILITSVVFAGNRERSALKIRFSDNRPIVVSIDGRSYDRHGKSLTFGNLPPGWHKLRVYEYLEYTRGGGRAKLLYSGSVRIRSGVVVYCIVDPETRRMRIRSEDIDDLYVDYTDESNVEEEVPPRHDERPEDRRLNRSDRAIAGDELKELELIVKSKVTDTEKLKYLKSVLKDKEYYLEDTRALMRLLSFESSKLDFAKWSYDRVINNSQYWKLDGEFTFDSSSDELQDFIEDKQR